MTAETITELDERTKEELQPPCEASTSYWLPGSTHPVRVDRCEQPASVLLRLVCTRCGTADEVFLCSDHATEGMKGGACHGTGNCDGAWRLVSAVWL